MRLFRWTYRNFEMVACMFAAALLLCLSAAAALAR